MQTTLNYRSASSLIIALLLPQAVLAQDSSVQMQPQELKTLGDLDQKSHTSKNSANDGASKDVEISSVPEATEKDAILKISKLIARKEYSAANSVFIINRPQYNSKNVLGYVFRETFERQQNKLTGDKAFFDNCRSQLQQRNFEELDKTYDSLLSSQKMFPNGIWYIDKYLNSICPAKAKDPDQTWLDQIALLKEWINSNPKSVPANVALANTWIEYGWRARGTDYANKVSKTSFATMGSRLLEAEKVLKKVSVHSPIWYHVSQTLALGQQWPKQEYNEMFEQCRKDYPNYYPAVFSHYWRLQPRWYGTKGEAKAYLESECKKLPGDEGNILYARTACSIKVDMITISEKFLGVDWEPTKAGMLALIKQNKDWYLGRALYSDLALFAGDTDAAKSAFEIYQE